MIMRATVSIHSNSSQRELIFKDHKGEYFSVELCGDVSAKVNVWIYVDESLLVKYFEQLSKLEKPWVGNIEWCSIEGEFSLSASCSSLGNVLFEITMRGIHGAPEEWFVKAGLTSEFGQLPLFYKQIKEFFA